MKIQTFKPEKYRDCAIYYRNFDYHFEYLAVINNELYTAHITIIPTRINIWLFKLGLEKTYFSEQQQQKILAQLRRLAETTVDFVLDKKCAGDYKDVFVPQEGNNN